jgi:hypothetical protein
MRTHFSAPSPFIHRRHHRLSPSPQSRSVALSGMDRKSGYRRLEIGDIVRLIEEWEVEAQQAA